MARRDGLLSLGARKPLCVEDPVAVRTAVRSRVEYDFGNCKFPRIKNSRMSGYLVTEPRRPRAGTGDRGAAAGARSGRRRLHGFRAVCPVGRASTTFR